jgi:KaiC/GvpD/RAD55 family RecA-like ATPase
MNRVNEFARTAEGNLLGSALRGWWGGDDSYLTDIKEARPNLPEPLMKAVEMIETSKSQGASSFEDFLCSLDTKNQQFFSDLEEDSASLTKSYFLVQLRKVQAPYIAMELSKRAENILSTGDLQPALDFLIREKTKSTKEKQPLAVMNLEELQMQPKVSWLIEGVLPTSSLACVYGPPAGGKSFLALDMAMRIAQGTSWEGHDTLIGSTLYIAAEGLSGLSDRVISWKNVYEEEDSGIAKRFSVIGRPVNVGDEYQTLSRAITSAGYSPNVIIIDTLSRCFGPNDENSTADMTKFIHALDWLRIEHDCTIMLVHHSARNERRTLRGNSAFEGALDTIIKVEEMERHANKRLKATIVKQKDGQDGQRYFYEISPEGNSAVLRKIASSVIKDETKGTEAGLYGALDAMIHSEDQWISGAEWRRAYSKMGPNFGSSVRKLVELGHVDYRKVGNSDQYRPSKESVPKVINSFV